jgi:hypothetical protein
MLIYCISVAEAQSSRRNVCWNFCVCSERSAMADLGDERPPEPAYERPEPFFARECSGLAPSLARRSQHCLTCTRNRTFGTPASEWGPQLLSKMPLPAKSQHAKLLPPKTFGRKGPFWPQGRTSHKQGSAFVSPPAEAGLPCIASLSIIQSATRQSERLLLRISGLGVLLWLWWLKALTYLDHLGLGSRGFRPFLPP